MSEYAEKSKYICKVKAIAAIQVIKRESIRGNEKPLDSGCVLKIEWTDCWICGKEKNQG